MNKYKVYSLYICCFLAIVVICHAIVWHLISNKVLLVDSMVYRGDLGRSSFKVSSIFNRASYLDKNAVNLKHKHFNFNDIGNNKIDIITMGDSFSNAATQGTNSFYQDYIATFNNLNVLNIPPALGAFNYILLLNNTGILDELKPKVVILQSVERFSISRFSKDIDFNVIKDKSEVLNTLETTKNLYQGKEQDISFLNDNNIKALKLNLQAYIKPYGTFKNCNIVPLNRDFFTSEDKNSLLFHKESIKLIPKVTRNSIKKLNENFNKLAKILKEKGIKLYFMPAVDKYNLYSKYIVDNPYPKSTFFELLRKLPKEYEFIDTKMILSKELEKGVKDLYYSDDTHWSYKASEAIFKKVKFE